VRELANAHNQEHLLVLELQHRVKNTLAIVQALAAQTFGAAVDMRAFKEAFTERLIALGRAHNVLSEAAWREVTLRTLVERTVEPFVGDQPDRLRVDGADLELAPDLVVDVALCLHELAANATKHGALSNPAGRVEVSWRRLSGGRVELRWTEHHGPKVAPPSHQGFGSRLLARGLSRRVKPSVVTDFHPDGLRWIAEFDAA
jgi:two-component sensor histidine kinase